MLPEWPGCGRPTTSCYADRRLGTTDASLVALAERLRITTVATFNRRDFDNVRPLHCPALTIVPD